MRGAILTIGSKGCGERYSGKYMPRKDDDPARIAELELENDELKREYEALKQRFAQREHDTAKIADALNEAQGNGGGESWQPKTYLLIFWAVVGVRILLTSYCPWLLFGFVSLIAEVLVVGPASVCLWKWGCGEVRKDLGDGLVKCAVMLAGLFVTAMIYSLGEVIHGYMIMVSAEGLTREPLQGPPLWAFLWFSLLMLLMLSPFCQWIKQNMTHNPKDWFRPEMGEGEAYDGLGEN